MLDKKTFVAKMKQLMAENMNQDEICNVLEKYGVYFESKPSGYMLDIAIDILSAAMDDECDLINYWFFDDDCGKHGLNLRKYAPSCPVEHIKTVEELYDALAEMHDEHYYDPTTVSYVQLECDRYGEPLIEVFKNRKTGKYMLYFDIACVENMSLSAAYSYISHAENVFHEYCEEMGIPHRHADNSTVPVLNLVNNGGVFSSISEIADYFHWATEMARERINKSVCDEFCDD